VTLGRIDLPLAPAGAPIQLPTWVPTTEAEAERWQAEQLDIWNRPDVRQLIDSTKGAIQAELKGQLGAIVPVSGKTMDQAQMAIWMASELAANGFPEDAEAAAEMTLRFLETQGQQLGFHPGVIGAADLVTSWPNTEQEATEWGYRLGANITAAYGVALPSTWNTKGLVVAVASTACLQAGVPFVGVAVVSVEALWDGKLSEDELRSIAIAVGTAISVVVGSYFGIPAPIAGILGALHTAITYDVLYEIFEWDIRPESEKRAAAWYTMLAAREAMVAECAAVVHDVWCAYNEYWNQVVWDLTNFFDRIVGDVDLGAGLRFFGAVNITHIEVPNDWANSLYAMIGKRTHLTEMRPLQHPIHKVCRSEEGCVYYGPGDVENEPPVTGYRRSPWPEDCYATEPAPEVTQLRGMPGAWAYAGGGGKIGIDPYLALSFYGANRYVTPWQPMMEHYYGTHSPFYPYHECYQRYTLPGGATTHDYGPCPDTMTQPDEFWKERIWSVQTAASAEELQMCEAPLWSQIMEANMLQIGPAMALVQADTARTVAAVIAEQALFDEILRVAEEERQTEALSALRILMDAATTRDLAALEAAAEVHASIQSGQLRLMTYEMQRGLAVTAARQRREFQRQKREGLRASSRLNYGLLAAGGGALAGWLAARILGR
jgi:hypothetical protein